MCRNPQDQRPPLTTVQEDAEIARLPTIVETADASPAAAKQVVQCIREYLADPAGTQSSAQDKAVMLIRILANNPGPKFTRNFDAKFVKTIKEYLRASRYWNVQHSLRDCLDIFERERSTDENLKPLLAMWTKEKKKPYYGHGWTNGWVSMHSRADRRLQKAHRRKQGQSTAMASPPPVPQRNHPRRLPSPEELAARIAEARNSAALLTEIVKSTPLNELEDNVLMKEFLDRCQSAQRILQGYIQSTDPAPDQDTLLTLIQTNEEISVAISRQQRAIFKARNLTGPSSPNSPNETTSPAPIASGAVPLPVAPTSTPPVLEQPERVVTETPNTAMTSGRTPGMNTRGGYNADEFQVRNPFADDYATEEEPRQASQTDQVRPQPAEQGR